MWWSYYIVIRMALRSCGWCRFLLVLGYLSIHISITWVAVRCISFLTQTHIIRRYQTNAAKRTTVDSIYYLFTYHTLCVHTFQYIYTINIPIYTLNGYWKPVLIQPQFVCISPRPTTYASSMCGFDIICLYSLASIS